jgi:Uncharacterized protein conserved in bacteria (DUF2252)
LAAGVAAVQQSSRPWTGRAPTDEDQATYGKLCGSKLARAHSRSGDRIVIAAYLGNGDSFDRAIVEFSKACADQNGRDHQELAAAVKSGRITAETSF